MTCPMLYRFRVIDKLPSPPTPATARGTLVHAVLERLFDLPTSERTLDAAIALVPREWERIASEEPEMLELLAEHDGRTDEWFSGAGALLNTWFGLEDPTRLEPAERELYVETEVDGLVLRGYVDRLDVAPNGAMRVVDYKTGRSPSERFEGKALFQMKFYALVLWRLRGEIPTSSSSSTSATERSSATSPICRTCSGSSARSRHCGPPSSEPLRSATGARARAGCATGVSTGASVRLGAVLLRTCPTTRQPEPSTRPSAVSPSSTTRPHAAEFPSSPMELIAPPGSPRVCSPRRHPHLMNVHSGHSGWEKWRDHTCLGQLRTFPPLHLHPTPTLDTEGCWFR